MKYTENIVHQVGFIYNTVHYSAFHSHRHVINMQQKPFPKQ